MFAFVKQDYLGAYGRGMTVFTSGNVAAGDGKEKIFI